MELRNRQRVPLSTGLGINLLASFGGLLATLQLVFWIWDFLEGFYQIPVSGISLFPDGELWIFFIVSFTVAGMLIGIATGLVQWWILGRTLTLSPHWILLSTISWLIGLPFSYVIFTLLFKLLLQIYILPFALSVATSMKYMNDWVFFCIYLMAGIIASIGEWLILKN